MNSKYPLLFVLLLFIIQLTKAQVNTPGLYFDNQPNYTKGAYAQNGFMLREKELVYNNTWLAYNSIQWGAADFLTLGAAIIIMPKSDPFWDDDGGVALTLNAKTGHSFGKFHHIAFSTNIVSQEPYLLTPSFAYTFGTPRYYAGLVWMNDNFLNNRNYVLLQSGFALGRHFAIACEFSLLAGSHMLRGGEFYPFQMDEENMFRMLSVMGKIIPGRKNRLTINIGYILDYGDRLPMIGFSVRLNKRKPESYKWQGQSK